MDLEELMEEFGEEDKEHRGPDRGQQKRGLHRVPQGMLLLALDAHLAPVQVARGSATAFL
ncbi:hypothetical protein D3C78_1938970 [compost metagenome]